MASLLALRRCDCTSKSFDECLQRKELDQIIHCVTSINRLHRRHFTELICARVSASTVNARMDCSPITIKEHKVGAGFQGYLVLESLAVSSISGRNAYRERMCSRYAVICTGFRARRMVSSLTRTSRRMLGCSKMIVGIII